jgi:hypothetical protein
MSDIAQPKLQPLSINVTVHNEYLLVTQTTPNQNHQSTRAISLRPTIKVIAAICYAIA